MRNILEDLNKEVGFKGSMIITPDGFMVASALGEELEEDLVAAIISSVLVSVKRALSQMNAPDELKACVLNATGGKIMFYDVGNTFLVVVADSSLRIDDGGVAIQSAIHRIQNRRVA